MEEQSRNCNCGSNNMMNKNCNYTQTDFLTANLKDDYYDLAFADCPIGKLR